MFEVFVIIVFFASGDRVVFTSENKYASRVECEARVEQGYQTIRRRVLSHAIEEFRVERGCRPVEEGA